MIIFDSLILKKFRNMIRKIHTSSAKRARFYHEQPPNNEFPVTQITRPPTAQLYSALKKNRSQ